MIDGIRVLRLWLRRDARDVIEAVDRSPIRARNQMPVRVDRYGNQPRSHLTRFAEAMLPLFDADTALADRRALERSGWNAHPPFVLPPWY